MLRVKTFLDKSILIPEAGLGLFADEDIPIGAIIWQFDSEIDREFSEEDFKRGFTNIRTAHTFLKKYCYLENNKYILCVDNSRFINHSNVLNNTTEEKYRTRAKRDIKKGEEIISHYGEFSSNKNEQDFNLEF